MSIECWYCERDLRGPHADDCPKRVMHEQKQNIDSLTAERDTAEANLERLQNKFEQVTGENGRLSAEVSELNRQLDACWDAAIGAKDHFSDPHVRVGEVMEILRATHRKGAVSGTESPTTCEWFEDDDGWHSGCGQWWEFTYDGPKENGVAFCMYCSKPVTVAEFDECDHSWIVGAVPSEQHLIGTCAECGATRDDGRESSDV